MGLTAGIKINVEELLVACQNYDLDLNLPIKHNAGKYEFTIIII